MFTGLLRTTRIAAVLMIVPCLLIGVSCVTAKTGNPIVIMETTKGNITIELDAENAPISTENFLWYVDNEFYEGLIFHRVKKAFMIQGGGFTKDMVKKEGRPEIKNEATNGLSNMRGTLAMARTGVIDSGTSQFFINVVDNKGLDHKDKTPQGYGYAVFGKVIDGMDTVDAIRNVETVTKTPYADVPATPVVITKAYRGKAPAKKDKTEAAAE